MNQFDIYVNVERPSGKQDKRKSFSDGSQSIYANEDEIHNLEPNRTGPALSGAGNIKKRIYRAAVLSLGLLCVLLLTGLITLVLKYTMNNSEHKMEIILLQTSYNNMTKERDQLQTSYNNLTKERDQLQTSYNNLTKERDQLQKGLEGMTKKGNDLQKKLQDLSEKLEWISFGDSFYHISSSEKSWKESRADCLQRHADLVIINSKKEQDFLRSFQKQLWIGLTDSEVENTWKWVDGTLLTTSYWSPSEPNGESRRDEDCAEIKSYHLEKSWNDESCNIKKHWICEKTII